MNKFTVVIPFRNQSSDRERNLNYLIKYVLKYIEDVSIIVIEQDTDTDIPFPKETSIDHILIRPNSEPFLKTKLMNIGFNHRKTDLLIFLDADCIPDKNILYDLVHHKYDEYLKTNFIIPYKGNCFYLGESESDSFIENEDSNISNNATRHIENILHTTGGIGVISAENYLKVGGHDERFIGWGGEDCNFHNKCIHTIGIHRTEGELIHLSHRDVPILVGSNYAKNCEIISTFTYKNNDLIVNTKMENFQIVDTKIEVVKSVYTNKKIKFIVPFIDRPYYLWQILIQINNFRKMGYEQDTIFLGTTFADMVTPELQKMVDSPNVKAKFVLYPEDRLIRRYPASLKPRTMAKYFRDFPEEKDTVYVYLDPDVIFLKPLEIDRFANDDIWYEGDTTGYLNSRYIKSKGEQLFLEMCMIVGIDPQVVMANDLNCGGAQFIIKNNTYELWHEIETLSVILYKHMDETKEKYCPPGQQYPIQAWAAEMWTTDWCAWKYGIETKVIPEMNFHMADHALTRLEYPFLHCTGNIIEGKAFNKKTYQDSPFKVELPDYADSITSLYVKEIREVKENFPDLIW